MNTADNEGLSAPRAPLRTISADEAFEMLRAEMAEEQRLLQIGEALLANGITYGAALRFVQGLMDARRRRDHAVVDYEGVTLDWEIAAVYRDEITRHVQYGRTRETIGPCDGNGCKYAHEDERWYVDDLAIPPDVYDTAETEIVFQPAIAA